MEEPEEPEPEADKVLEVGFKLDALEEEALEREEEGWLPPLPPSPGPWY